LPTLPVLERGPPVCPGASGVRQDEEPFALVRRADFRRREYARMNVVTHAEKIRSHLSQSDPHMPSHVLEEAPGGLNISNDG
jgi:hypothetical protein